MNIKKETADRLEKEFSIDKEVTELLFDKKVLHEPDCRNFLIREEYGERSRPGEKQRVKAQLADKYCISVELVEKVVKKL